MDKEGGREKKRGEKTNKRERSVIEVQVEVVVVVVVVGVVV